MPIDELPPLIKPGVYHVLIQEDKRDILQGSISSKLGMVQLEYFGAEWDQQRYPNAAGVEMQSNQ